MSEIQVLLVAGTHGNESNPIWLFDQWKSGSIFLESYGIKTVKEIGNPKARMIGKRYVDCDLNRSFANEKENIASLESYEKVRAKELVDAFGPQGSDPCKLVIDFHTTTSNMGSCLVIYGRRFADLCLAAIIQDKLGLPIYLHESDDSQTGFLVESWPCGLVVEIGPVAQGLLNTTIISQVKIILEISLELISQMKSKQISFPEKVIIHTHMGSIDYPRDDRGEISAFIHPFRQSQDWKPIECGSPLFMTANNQTINFNKTGRVFPVFINEAAYMEKGIAMSFTKREILPFNLLWSKALQEIFDD